MLKTTRYVSSINPDIVLELLKIPGVVIAGGYVRNLLDKRLPINDIDVFFLSRQAFEFAKQYLAIRSKCEKIFTCPEDKLHTYKYDGDLKIQLIAETFYINVEALLNSFDFTICQFALTFIPGDGNTIDVYTIHHFQESYEDLNTRTLKVNKITYPAATLKRVNKYINYGFKANAEFFTDLVRLIRESDDKNDETVYID